ncbi:MAG: hypothetical protein GY851_05860, partial [bacterium]|nr:hypothetical protein [bacterium]
GVNGGASYFASLHHTMKDAQLKHGRAAVHESMVGIGTLVGCTAFGLLAAQYGTTWPLIFTPAFVFVGLVFQGALLQYVRHRERCSLEVRV